MIQKNKPLRYALVCGVMLASALTQQTHAQSGTSAAVPGAETQLAVRPEIGVFLQDAQRLLGEEKTGEAAAKLLAAELVANKTPYELYILARLKGALAGATGDAELAVQQYELASQGPWFKPADRVTSLQSIVGLYYNAKNYAKAIEWIERYLQAGGTEPTMSMVRAQSYYLKADYANAAKALDAEVSQASAAGKVPAELQLKLLADSRNRLKDGAGYTQALEALVQYYPSQANWQSLMARLWAKPSLVTRLQLDVFRLQLAVAGLVEASDYTEMAELALQSGSAIEASKVLEQGYNAGVLGADDKTGQLQRLKDKLARAVAEDRNTLEKDVVRAKTQPDGIALFNHGFNMFHLGQAERGMALMEQGLAKGIARNADLARLRLVAVYVQLNQRDKASQLLSTLAGKTEPVGLEDTVRYWKLYLR